MGKKRIKIEIILGIIISICLFLYLYLVKFIPTGNDIFGHLYKAQFLTNEIKNGNYYPLYSKDWYNGIQLFRYWPIFTYYILSGINLIVKDIIISYYLFLSLTFLLSFIGWCLIANRDNKNIYIILGLLYWFLPDNLRVIFGEGNLARVLIFSILPIFFYFFTNLIEYKKSFIPTVICIFIITNTHFMLAAMSAIIFCIYSFFVGLRRKTWYLGFTSFIIGFLLSGIVLLPGLQNNIISQDNSAVKNIMLDWSQSLFTSINPFNRLDTSICCSFGLAMIILILINIINKQKTGSIVALIFFILTSDLFIPLLIQLPLSQIWWMTRFVQMCYVLIIYETGKINFEHKNLIKISIPLIIILDIIPSLGFFTNKEYNEINTNDYLFDEAIDLVDSRLGLIDETTFGSYISYYILEKDVPYVQGWAIQGASTNENIVTLTESVKFGYYGYTFKSLLELGCDSVLIKKDLLINFNEKDFFDKATYYGYELINENNNVYLFDNKKITQNYGINFEYNNLAIGKSSIYISYIYPSFKVGDSINLDDYSYEELSKYNCIYLSNFEYSNKTNFENLLVKLNNNGTKIIIDTTHLAINYLSIATTFDIESRFISIYNLNKLSYKGVDYSVSIPYEWYSTYLVSNNKNSKNYNFNYGEENITYLSELGNIKLLGLNLIYLYIENKTDGLKDLLDVIFDYTEDYNSVPYDINNIDIVYGNNTIIIQSDIPCLTNIAYQDNFKTNQNIENQHNLIYIKDNCIIIDIYYKSLFVGLIISIFGLIFMIIFNYLIKKYNLGVKNEK